MPSQISVIHLFPLKQLVKNKTKQNKTELGYEVEERREPLCVKVQR